MLDFVKSPTFIQVLAIVYLLFISIFYRTLLSVFISRMHCTGQNFATKPREFGAFH